MFGDLTESILDYIFLGKPELVLHLSDGHGFAELCKKETISLGGVEDEESIDNYRQGLCHRRN